MCSFISEAHCVHGSFTDSAVNVLRTENVTLMSPTLIPPQGLITERQPVSMH